MSKSWIAAIRKVTQISMFLVAGKWLAIGWIRCPFAVPYVMCTACPVTNCPGRWLQVWFIGLLTVSQIISHRLFCGWICPMGLIEEFCGGRALQRVLNRIRSAARSLSPSRLVKFAFLAFVVVVFCLYDWQTDYRPYDYVVRSPRTLSIDAPLVAMQLGLHRYGFRVALAAIAILGAILIGRFWCRHLCPLGALLALARTPSLLKLRIDEKTCTHCGMCLRVCPMRTLPKTGECISCMECWSACPTDAIRLEPLHSAKIANHALSNRSLAR